MKAAPSAIINHTQSHPICIYKELQSSQINQLLIGSRLLHIGTKYSLDFGAYSIRRGKKFRKKIIEKRFVTGKVAFFYHNLLFAHFNFLLRWTAQWIFWIDNFKYTPDAYSGSYSSEEFSHCFLWVFHLKHKYLCVNILQIQDFSEIVCSF